MGVAERALITDIAEHGKTCLEDFTRYRFACRFVRGRRVLDVACGSGYGSALLYREGGAARVFGLDASRDGINESRRFRLPGSIEFIVGDAGRLPFQDGEIETVVSLETLEHLPSPEIFVGEVARVLRAGGKAIISTPLNNSDGRYCPDNPYHRREYSKDEFLKLLRQVFREVEIFSQVSDYEYDPLPLALERMRGHSWVRRAVVSCVPSALRRQLRYVARSKGTHLATSVIEPGYHDKAAYQVAVCG